LNPGSTTLGAAGLAGALAAADWPDVELWSVVEPTVPQAARATLLTMAVPTAASAVARGFMLTSSFLTDDLQAVVISRRGS
jgi:hypothetical protein